MSFITIKIPTFDTNDLKKRVLTSLDRRGRRNENLLLRTTQYFDTVRPTFQSELQEVGDSLEMVTGPVDDESGRIWSYLDQGTDVRFFYMVEGYAAGTTPGTFETQPAVGRRGGFSRDDPAEGIEARGWTDLLAEQEQPRFQSEMGSTLNRWIRNWAGRASEIISG